MALWVTFVPCFLWIFAGAPFIDRIAGRPRLGAALAAITAAVVGVILNLSVWFAHPHAVRRGGADRGGPLAMDLPVPRSFRPGPGRARAPRGLAPPAAGTGPCPASSALAAALGLALHAVGLA